jgi:catechol 2,3-dioxygenase-like lactoylglutathione lyase family enzyme
MQASFMQQSIATMAYLVKDYDEAIGFFVEMIGFELLEDTCLEQERPGKRWVVVKPRGPAGCSLLLAKAEGHDQLSAVGNQSGGRVFLFLQTDDFWRDHDAMNSKGVVFTAPPREETYGTVAVFLDLYGNKWDLIQSSTE